MDKKDLTETIQGIGQWFMDNAESIAMNSMVSDKLSVQIELSEKYDIVFPKISIEHIGKPLERYVPGAAKLAQEMGFPLAYEE